MNIIYDVLCHTPRFPAESVRWRSIHGADKKHRRELSRRRFSCVSWACMSPSRTHFWIPVYTLPYKSGAPAGGPADRRKDDTQGVRLIPTGRKRPYRGVSFPDVGAAKIRFSLREAYHASHPHVSYDE